MSSTVSTLQAAHYCKRLDIMSVTCTRYLYSLLVLTTCTHNFYPLLLPINLQSLLVLITCIQDS